MIPKSYNNNNMRRRKRQNKRVNNPNRISTIPEVFSHMPTLKTKRTLTTTNFLTLVPTTGITVAGLSSSKVLGLYVTGSGISFFNTSVGPSVPVTLNFINNTGYSQIFDQFRILKLRITGWFQNDTSSTSSITTGMPLFYTAIDYDANNAPPDPASVLGLSSSIVSQAAAMGKPCFSRTFQPRVLNALTNNVLTSNAYSISPPGTWIDNTSYNTACHYGMYIGWDTQSQSLATSIGALTLVCECEMEFRSTL